ncbi:restriction endonuclease subunit S [Saccharospirillum alexandrii]|uniref:restriction endonuclease subunit S n=1 Tax=Saccharospirillum alexandrii TaxID=2448477 RepID=UPI000FD988BF|nr:restriction endonuclease subunit S [Saccharospirillum alexandrii]
MFEERPLGSLIDRQTGGGTPSRQVPSFWKGKIPWASVKDFKDDQSSISETEEYISEEGLRASASNLIPENTVLICSRMAVGRAAISKVSIAINQDLKALFPKAGVDQRYLLRVFQWVKRQAENLAVGSTVKGIRIADLLGLQIPVAPEVDQPAIANILDTLDTQIRQTEAIIVKLQQVKQGMLHDLLTRGIDANGQLRPPRNQAPGLYKESPLGWIPREWEVRNLSQLTSLITSGSRGWALYYSDTGSLFLRSQNVRMGCLDLSERQCVKPPTDGEGLRTRVEALDLLVTITGNGVGNLAYLPDGWSEIAFVSQHVALVRFVDPWLAKLANHYLVLGGPGRQQIVDAQYGQSKPGLNLESLRNIRIPAPSNTESEEIIARVALLNKRVEDEVSLVGQLHSVKAGLMDDLLTGRVRVTSLLDTAKAS